MAIVNVEVLDDVVVAANINTIIASPFDLEIFDMWFIIYQMALIFFDIIAILFEWDTIAAIKSFQIPNFSLFGWDGTISMLPLIIIGFGLNLSIIALLFLMSYSHKFHNFIMVLSHHNQPDYGSPVPPETREALALAMIDDFDAKMNILDKAYQGVTPGEWTQKVFTIDDRYFYLPLYTKETK